MRFSKSIKANGTGIVLCALMGLAAYIYFVVYLTPDRVYWYNDMVKQIQFINYELTH